MPSTTAPVHPDGESAPALAPLSSTALAKLLLDENDLGGDYTRRPQRLAAHDDVTVVGCPALAKLGSDATTGSSLAFPRKAKASFTYAGGSNSELAEELYSDTAAKLSKGIGEVFDAMVSCPTYQVVSGSAVVTVGTQVTAAPDLGDEQWSHLLTYSIGGQRNVVKQTANPDRQRPCARLGGAGACGRQPGEGARQGRGSLVTALSASFGVGVPHETLSPCSPIPSVPVHRCCAGCCRRAHATGSCTLQQLQGFPRCEAGCR
jgi:hypothetical protein